MALLYAVKAKLKKLFKKLQESSFFNPNHIEIFKVSSFEIFFPSSVAHNSDFFPSEVDACVLYQSLP